MAAETIGVGIIGASAEGGWAKESHVPAVRALAGLELVAVATTSQSSADAAARAFGARTGYGDAAAMFRDSAVELVAIAVKVPAHRDLVLGALAAGKHVLCEWPLGRNMAESQELAEAAERAAVRVAIGLQTRENPAVRRAQELVRSGALGRILSARVVSTTAGFGPEVPSAMTYAEDPANGVTLLSIQGARTLDLAIALLGAFSDLSALAATQYPEIRVGDDATPAVRTTPDHVLVQSRLASGAILGVDVAGGFPPDDTPFRFEVFGERGRLALAGGALRGFQSGRLRLEVDGTVEPTADGETGALPDSAANVADTYAIFRDDIVNNTRTVPDFEHAVRLSRLIDAVLASSSSGSRLTAQDWPTW